MKDSLSASQLKVKSQSSNMKHDYKTTLTHQYMITSLVGCLEHEFYGSIQLGIITPTDFHIFQRGWNHQPDDYILIPQYLEGLY